MPATALAQSTRRSRRVTRDRIALIRELAPDGDCGACGTRCRHRALEIDHVDGRLWESNKLGSHARVAKYRAELAAGVKLRAICRSCSARQGGRRYCSSDRARRRAKSSRVRARRVRGLIRRWTFRRSC